MPRLRRMAPHKQEAMAMTRTIHPATRHLATHGHTPTSLAATIGCTQEYVSMILAGKRRPTGKFNHALDQLGEPLATEVRRLIAQT